MTEKEPQIPEHTEVPEHTRWQLLRDVLAFQLKLAMDGLRDVLLSPISIGAALIGVFSDSNKPGKYFYRLLKLGHRSDIFINLFNEHNTAEHQPSADNIVKKAESLVVGEYEKGGVVTNLKNRTDKVIDKIHSTRDEPPAS
jgi:hypothetical protein